VEGDLQGELGALGPHLHSSLLVLEDLLCQALRRRRGNEDRREYDCKRRFLARDNAQLISRSASGTRCVRMGVRNTHNDA
jgi:hypothetical protein